MRNILIIGVVILLVGAGALYVMSGSNQPQGSPNSESGSPGGIVEEGSGTQDGPAGGTSPALETATASAAVRALIQTGGTAQSQIDIVSMEAKEWPDGCLGLAEADEFCTQALVPGYKVTAKVGAETRIYRTNGDGSVIRREK